MGRSKVSSQITTVGIDDLLLHAVSPGMYGSNAFRVLGLPVDASPQQVNRHAQKLVTAAKFGGDPRTLMNGVLPPDRPPDEEAIQNALQQVRDPVQRLIHELFWFWPLSTGADDAALGALRRGDYRAAMAAWNQHEEATRDPVTPA